MKFSIYCDFQRSEKRTLKGRFLFWVRSGAPQTAFLKIHFFQKFSRNFQFFVIFREARNGLSRVDFYSGWGREHVKRLFWKSTFFGNFLEMLIFRDFQGSEKRTLLGRFLFWVRSGTSQKAFLKNLFFSKNTKYRVLQIYG